MIACVVVDTFNKFIRPTETLLKGKLVIKRSQMR